CLSVQYVNNPHRPFAFGARRVDPSGRLADFAVKSLCFLLANGFDSRCLRDTSVVSNLLPRNISSVLEMPVMAQALQQCTTLVREHVSTVVRHLCAAKLFATAPQELQTIIVAYLVQNKTLEVDERFIYNELTHIARPVRMLDTTKLLFRVVAGLDIQAESRQQLNDLLASVQKDVVALVNDTMVD
ncbi:MAG: hypothetical protein MHM6MM_007662, partial [Cercozoa sp. M6MM]